MNYSGHPSHGERSKRKSHLDSLTGQGSGSPRSQTTTISKDSEVGLTSGVLGGITSALGMRPPTAKEVRLEEDNRKLKEENKLLKAEYYNIQTAARKYYHDAFRLHHENQRLTETLEAMSLEIKGVTKRYEEAKSLSEIRLKRLLAAQVFLTFEGPGASSSSISELLHKVDVLNGDEYLRSLLQALE